MIDILSFHLVSGGNGTKFHGAACAVELSNLIASGAVQVPEEWMPPCPLEPAAFRDDHPSISRVIRAYVVSLNDGWNDEDRQRLRPYSARILCTATGAADEETRAWLATDWLTRVHTPAFLRLAGLEEHARALEGLARITDAVTVRSAQRTIAAARSAASAAGVVDWSSWVAVAAADAAGDAAWYAGGVAARAAADAADAAWHAGGVAGGVALRLAAEMLQASALELLDEMIAVGKSQPATR